MPVKFDDLPKVATEVLNDDYQTSGKVLKAKQKTALSGATVTTQVDLFQHDTTSTPAKLTWKLPALKDFRGLAIDKLETDKSGKFKFEASADKVGYNGLKLECKTDIVDRKKDVLGFTYTGIKDAQAKLEFKAANPRDFTGEVTFSQSLAHGDYTCGMKLDGKQGILDLGVRMLSGPFFGALQAKCSQDSPPTTNASLLYKPSPDVRCAVTYQQGGKGDGNFTIGGVYKGLYKVKVTQDQTLSFTAKHALAKGFTVLLGGSYNIKKSKNSMGVQLSIE